MNRLTKLLSIAALVLGSMSANASILWNFSYSGSGVSAAGTLTTDSTLNAGAYLVTGIEGQRNGEAITTLIPAGTYGTLFSNNLLFASGPYFDNSGITFLTSSGAFNLCYAGSGCGSSGYQDIVGSPLTFTSVQLTVTRVPEPASIALLGLGLLVMVAVRRNAASKL